jgi:hypothetical protein
LTDLFLDKEGRQIPLEPLCTALRDICLPLGGRRIVRLQMRDPSIASADELMTEFELCVGLIFKPFRHHLRTIMESEDNLVIIWKFILQVMEDLVRGPENKEDFDARSDGIQESLKAAMIKVAHEHFQNSIIVLSSAGVLTDNSAALGDLTFLTWDAASRMGINDKSLKDWKNQATRESSDMHGGPEEEKVELLDHSTQNDIVSPLEEAPIIEPPKKKSSMFLD